MGQLSVLYTYVTVEQENAIRQLYQQHGWVLVNKEKYLPEDLKEQIRQLVEHIQGGEQDDNLNDDNADDDTSDKEVLPDTELVNVVTENHKHAVKEENAVVKAENTTLVDERLLRKLRRENNQTSLQTRTRKNTKNGKKNSVDNVVGKEVEDNDETNKLDKKLRCKQCDYTSDFNSNYLRHIREAHTQVRHQCPRCRKSFKSKHEAKSHLQNAHISSLKCEKCDKQFTSRGGLLNHNKHVHLKKVLYKCEICESTFFYKQHYQGHMNRHSLDRPFKCRLCSKPFSYKSSWNSHEKTCSGQNYYESHNSDGTLKEVQKRKVLCHICGEELSNKSSLKTHHKFVHSNEPKTECELCGKTFKGVYSLQRHKQIVHTESKDANLPCEICGRVFNQIQILRQHVKRHNREFSVFCSTCEKGFYSNYKLKEHERSHTGEKPYSCDTCNNFKCSTKTNLLKHLKTHEVGRKTNERKKKKKAEIRILKVENKQKSQSDLPLVNNSEHVITTDFVIATDNLDGRHSKQEHLYNPQVITTNEQVIPCHMTDMNTNHMTGANIHGNHDNLSNMTTMPMNNEMMRYDQAQYSHEGMIQHGDGNYDPRLHSEGYYGNMHSNSAGQIPQGLNILTVAMNMVNPDPY